MRRSEPQHIGSVVSRVLLDIAANWEKHHGRPSPDHVRDLITGDTTGSPSFLNPCPDCGGHIVTLGDRIDGVLMFHAECESCRRKGASCRSREEAVADWNMAA